MKKCLKKFKRLKIIKLNKETIIILTFPIIIDTSTLINGINDVPIEWEPTIFTEHGLVKRNVPSILFLGFK